ncbi:conserved hypothetical protein [uncultured Paludibacter sp.]|uniref:Uncharacterized protein n=1 Tax=uncultured Paludibacter sp. TaxID=497635 RepID=A0A653AH12_9BACT|nr:conserved hypothetical protein [uncultured Paludibacter sp.]
METNKTIEQVLNDFIPEKIIQKKKSPLFSFIYIAIGILIFVINSKMEYNPSGFLYPLNLSAGSILIVMGIFSFFYRKLHYYDVQTGKMLKNHDFYFDAKEQHQLVKIIENGNVEEIINLKKSAVHSLKMRVLSTNDGKWCFVCVLLFVLQQYEPVSKVVKYDADKAKALFNALSI